MHMHMPHMHMPHMHMPHMHMPHMHVHMAPLALAGLAARDTASAIDEYRSFVLHEIFHGLGFVNTMFNYAKDSTGARKGLLELKKCAPCDLDGANDTLW